MAGHLASPAMCCWLSRWMASRPQSELQPAAEFADLTTIALGWAAFAESLERARGSTLLRHPEPHFLALLGLAIERLCHGSRAAHLAQSQNVHLKLPALRFDLE